jgi:hypothetical protein
MSVYIFIGKIIIASGSILGGLYGIEYCNNKINLLRSYRYTNKKQVCYDMAIYAGSAFFGAIIGGAVTLLMPITFPYLAYRIIHEVNQF